MSLFSVNTNLGALAALQSLNATQQAENTAQNEVSTGKKVSSAADDPAIYSIANTINANIAGLSAVSDSLNFGAQVVTTASSAVSSINTVLTDLQNKVTSAGQSGITLATLQQSITSDLTGINTYAADATFSGVNLLQPAAAGGSTTLNVVQNISGSNPLTLGNQADAGNAGPAFQQFSDALGLSNLSVLGVQATAGTPGLQIGSNVAFGSASSVANTFSDTTAATNHVLTLSTKNAAGVTTTTNFEFIDVSAGATNNTQLQTAVTANTKAVAVDFNSVTDSTNQVVAKLAATLQGAGFGVVQQSDGSLNIAGNGLVSAKYGSVSAGTVTPTAAITSATTTAQTDATSGVSLSALTNTATAVTLVSAAVTKLNGIASNLGAASQQITGIQNFTSALSSALTAGVGALTDADLASESARLSALQTKQQLATQSLTIANSQPQSLLSLFKNL